MNSVPGMETEEYTTNRMSSGIGLPYKFANKNILLQFDMPVMFGGEV